MSEKTRPEKLIIELTDNIYAKTAEWIAIHLAELTAAVERLTEAIEKREKP